MLYVLITNDRDFEEPELWIPLCQYIDKMIMSSPDQWEKYFDHRFPQDMLDGSMSALRSFYATFCDIILLPIKEMVRGSMKCRSAMEILKIAKVDVTRYSLTFDIPQLTCLRGASLRRSSRCCQGRRGIL